MFRNRLVVFVLAYVSLLVSCSENGLTVGNEGQFCYPNFTCNDDLECKEGICVAIPCAVDERRCNGSVIEVCSSASVWREFKNCHPDCCSNGNCVDCSIITDIVDDASDHRDVLFDGTGETDSVVTKDTIATDGQNPDCYAICTADKCGEVDGCDCPNLCGGDTPHCFKGQCSVCAQDADCVDVSLVCINGNCVNKTIKLSDKVVFLEDPVLAASRIDNNRIVFQESGTGIDPEVLKKIQVGSILVGGYQGLNQSGRAFSGYLKKVIAVDRETQPGFVYVAETEAKVTEAIDSCSISERVSLQEAQMSGVPRSSSGGWDIINVSGTKLIDESVGGVDVLVEIEEGLLSFTPDLELKLVIEDGRVEHFSAELVGSIDSSLLVRGTVSKQINEQWSVPLWTLAPSIVLKQWIPTPWGVPFPLVEVLDVRIVGEASINADATFDSTFGFTAGAEMRAGLAYDDGSWSAIKEYTPSYSYQAPSSNFSVDFDASVSLKAEVSIKLYGVAGPTIEVEPGLSLEAVYPPCEWALKGFVDGRAYGEFSILDFGLSTPPIPIFEYEKSLKDGCCGNFCETLGVKSGSYCDGNYLVECKSGVLASCGVEWTRKSCQAPDGICNQNQCVECVTSSDCPGGGACSNNQCIDDQCGGYGETCCGTSCDSPYLCDDGFCCGSGQCFNNGCHDFSNSYCGTSCQACQSGYSCSNGKCVQNTCSSNFCQDEGYGSGSYCDGSKVVTCQTSGSCKTVKSTTSCSGTKPYCDDATCVECTKSTECDSGFSCDGGQCVCTPKTCDQLGRECGNWDNGCGSIISCGSCDAGQCNDGTCALMTWVDEGSNLEWEVSHSCVQPTWEGAKTYCDNLELDGSDWRLPTINELRSLVRGCWDSYSAGACGVRVSCLSKSCETSSCDGCSGGLGPSEGGLYWPHEVTGCPTGLPTYWTSSEVSDQSEYCWVVDFYDGEVSSKYCGPTLSGHVRCVR